ncbi:MAG: hypothetical protein NT069_29325, partial [Planctomycetota bacterium]|nr:hypothetical protein [Planctomycetota bacterium]
MACPSLPADASETSPIGNSRIWRFIPAHARRFFVVIKSKLSGALAIQFPLFENLSNQILALVPGIRSVTLPVERFREQWENHRAGDNRGDTLGQRRFIRGFLRDSDPPDVVGIAAHRQPLR